MGDSQEDDAVSKLQAQLLDLTQQVTSLNSKLVAAYDRQGDLEEELDRSNSNRKHLTARVAALDSERQQWEERMEGGLLIEKAHVQSELTRMMDRVIEETAERGKAEQDKKAFENELDELSASLFNEANRMVAVERSAKLQAEAKSASLEERLKDTEMAIHSQSKQLSSLGTKLEAAERERDEVKDKLVSLENDPATFVGKQSLSLTMPNGEIMKAPLSASQSRPPSPSLAFQPQMPFSLNHPLPALAQDILPFHEFMAFIRHLSRARATAQRIAAENSPSLSAPTMQSTQDALTAILSLTGYLNQPFIKRAIEEDTDPTLRLDLAPGLNWLSRRSVNSAIIDGHLVIEPLFQGSQASLPASTCALCGSSVELPSQSAASSSQNTKQQESTANTVRKLIDKSGNWASYIGRASSPSSSSTTKPSSQLASNPSVQMLTQSYIFKTDNPNQSNTRHSLCHAYCLGRLRAVCEFWGYVRAMTKNVIMDEVQNKPVQIIPAVSMKEEPKPPLSKDTSDDEQTPKLSQSASQDETSGQDGSKDGISAAVLGDPIQLTSEEKQSQETSNSKAEEIHATSSSESLVVSTSEAGRSVDSFKEASQEVSAPVEDLESTPKASSNTPAGQGSKAETPKPPLPRRSQARGAGGKSPSSPNLPLPPPKRIIHSANPSELRSRSSGLSTGDAANAGPPALSRQNSYVNLEQLPKSWEEKTWSEIVRLKEAMFWSRAGAREL